VAELRATLAALAQQTREPDVVLVVGRPRGWSGWGDGGFPT